MKVMNILKLKNVITQLTINTKPKIMFIENNIPTYVATPLPPLNFKPYRKYMT